MKIMLSQEKWGNQPRRHYSNLVCVLDGTTVSAGQPCISSGLLHKSLGATEQLRYVQEIHTLVLRKEIQLKEDVLYAKPSPLQVKNRTQGSPRGRIN